MQLECCCLTCFCKYPIHLKDFPQASHANGLSSVWVDRCLLSLCLLGHSLLHTLQMWRIRAFSCKIRLFAITEFGERTLSSLVSVSKCLLNRVPKLSSASTLLSLSPLRASFLPKCVVVVLAYKFGGLCACCVLLFALLLVFPFLFLPLERKRSGGESKSFDLVDTRWSFESTTAMGARFFLTVLELSDALKLPVLQEGTMICCFCALCEIKRSCIKINGIKDKTSFVLACNRPA